MTIPTLSTLPVAPARTDPPATFVTRADAFLAAIVTFQGEMNTSIGAMNTDIAGVNADATAAAASASAAASSATAAANAAGAALWVSGQAYAEGDAAISLVNYQTYRAETATSGTTDPSLDANWTAISGTFPVQTGNAGKFLSTDGTDPSWAEVYPSQSGNDGKFLTTDGTNTSWGDVPSGTYEFTASGSITAGDTVALNDDDTVSTIFTSGAAGEVGTAVQWRTSSLGYTSLTYSSTNNNYRAWGGTSSTFGYSLITVSGTTVSSGSFSLVSNAYTVQNLTAAYNPTDNRNLAFFTSQSQSDQGVIFIGANDSAFGTFTNFPLRVDNQHVIYDPTSAKFVAIYKDLTTTGQFQVRTITNSGNTPSFGSAATVTTSTSGANESNLCYDPDSTKVLAAYRVDSRLRFKVLTISGTSISLGSEVLLPASVTEPSNSSFSNVTLVYDTVNSRFVVSYRTDAGYAEVAYGTLSGTTTSWSTPVRISATQLNSDGMLDASYNSSTGQLDLFVEDSANSDFVWSIDISGATPTFDKSASVNSVNANALATRMIYDSTNNVNVLQNGTFAQAQRPDTLFENASRFYGIAASSAADGQTVTLNLEGTVNENQSGLSINQGYWVALDGSLSTTDTGYPFVGYGVAADKLFLSHLPVQTGNSGKFLTTDGTSTSWGAIGLNLIQEVTASNDASVILSGFSDAYDSYQIELVDIYGGNSAVLRARIYNNGSEITSGYNSSVERRSVSSSTFSAQGYSSDSSLALTGDSIGGSSGSKMGLSMRVFNQDAGPKAFTSHGIGNYGGSNNCQAIGASGAVGELTDMKFFLSTGNIYGTFRLYGITKG